MSKEKDTGDPAFPVMHSIDCNKWIKPSEGTPVRDLWYWAKCSRRSSLMPIDSANLLRAINENKIEYFCPLGISPPPLTKEYADGEWRPMSIVAELAAEYFYAPVFCIERSSKKAIETTANKVLNRPGDYLAWMPIPEYLKVVPEWVKGGGDD